MNTKMITTIVNFILVIAVAVGLYFMWGAFDTSIDPETKQPVGNLSAASNAIGYSVMLFYVTLALVIIFSIWGIIINPRKFIPSAIGFGLFALILVISLGMASSEAEGRLAGMKKIGMATDEWIKWSDVGVKMTIILIAIAIIVMVAQAVRNLLGYFSK